MPTALPLDARDLARTRLPLEQATLLPAAAFTHPDVLAWELDELFLGGWACVGHREQVGARGRFVVRDVGAESVLVVGDDEGRPRAFLNVCRHRGARLVDRPEGELPRLQCPYHAWSYGFDGALRNAPHTEGLENFEPSCFGLHPVRTAEVEGLVFVDVNGDAPPIEDHVGELADELARYELGGLRRAAEMTYEVDANWKAIAENYSECLHCPGVHPELNRLSHYLSGETITGAGAWCGGSMTLRDGTATMARDGGVLTRPPIAGLDAEAERAVLYFVLFPNALVSLHPDYVMLHTLWPRAANRTEVRCEWFFEPRTMARDDFDPGDAVAFWDQVNREDWHVCELTQRGMGSARFVPGRYSNQEDDVHAFDLMVVDRYAEALA